MNLSSNDQPKKTEPDDAAFIGIDWADQQQACSLQVAGQSKKETGTVEQKPEVIGPWVAKLRERFGGRPRAVAVEQSRGPLIHALQAYDFLVLDPLHPTTVARFREAFKSSGAKSDPLDTDQIQEILTKHLARLKPLNPDPEATRLLARLVADRRKTVDPRTGHIQGAWASLKEYFPQALELCRGHLTSRLAQDLLKRWPTFAAFQQAKPSTVKRFFYGHNVRSPERIEKAQQSATHGQALTADPAIVESGRRLTQMHLAVLQALNPVIEAYDCRIEKLFQAHEEAPLFNPLPGAGPALGPRLLTFFGTDRARYATAANAQSCSGIAPVTQSSGKSRVAYVRRACPKFDRQTFHEFARLSVAQSQWARNHVEHYTARGKKDPTIIRALAFKWLRILFRCWQNRTPYTEAPSLHSLAKRGSIFATLHLKSA